MNEMNSKLIDLNVAPLKDVLGILLEDKSSKQNIIWATDDYIGHKAIDNIAIDNITGENSVIIQPRCLKSKDDQFNRTRRSAEVFTPIWICNQMNNHCDEEWFGYKDVFNKAISETSWITNKEPVKFPEKEKWKKYIDSKRVEITCGEAPFIVSRYDSATGKLIDPPIDRIGILDRKLRVVSENTDDKADWEKWAVRAVQSCYGYEFQGDSLLIARANVLLSFIDWYKYKWNCGPSNKLVKIVANIISWNLWQMDGFTDSTPLGLDEKENSQTFLFEDENKILVGARFSKPCKIFDWRADRSVFYRALKR